MIRWSLLLSAAAGLTAYAFWVYLRVELPVPGARRLALVRAAALVLVLLLFFDLRLPAAIAGGSGASWVLLDASLSMGADPAAWNAARGRAMELRAQGWTVVTFGDAVRTAEALDVEAPRALRTVLAPALTRAAEGGAREVRVLSDFRLEDAVAVRSALATLPLRVELEAFGRAAPNAGVSIFDVPDLSREGDSVSATLEVHGGTLGDSLSIEVLEEGRSVATARVAAPSPGLRARASVALPPPATTGRVRYTAAVAVEGDAFESDDSAVAFANVGYEEGGLVLVSLGPDWEPRFLAPVLEDATGLSTTGYLRAGPDRFVRLGRASDVGGTVDSATVGRAASEAALLVVHGVGRDVDEWGRALVRQPSRKVLLVRDREGATLAGVASDATRDGEWYASTDVPSSPIAGALAGVRLDGLPPLTDVIVVDEPTAVRSPLIVQLRGSGLPQPVLHLADGPDGRTAVALASGFWRWAARPSGGDAYRRLWSGVAGWLLADQAAAAGEPRPTRWVFGRGEPVVWSVPPPAAEARLSVRAGDGVGRGDREPAPGGGSPPPPGDARPSAAPVVDTLFPGGGTFTSGVLPPGPYEYLVEGADGDTLGSGRFDVAAATEEMVPAPAPPEVPTPGTVLAGAEGTGGPPLRTQPWPYLLVIILLCAEWMGRRRSGLR